MQTLSKAALLDPPTDTPADDQPGPPIDECRRPIVTVVATGATLPQTVRDATISVCPSCGDAQNAPGLCAACRESGETLYRKHICYDYEAHDYALYLDNELVGFARTYHEAEVTLDQLVLELIGTSEL